MFRAIPINNKLCFDKQLKRSWKIHEQKLRSIKSSINKQSPKHYTFLDQRAKRLALQDVRNIQINKQNSSLLTKIKVIQGKGSKSSYIKNVNCVDKKKTLNEGYRKKQLVKIVEENQQIAKRILEKKSQYNVRKWQKQRKNIQKNINLISSFPFKNYPETHTQVNLWMTGPNDSLTQIRKTKLSNFSLGKSWVKKQDLIFSGTHKIGQQYYLIETNLKDKIFSIQIENLQKEQQKFRLQMSQKQAEHMVQNNFQGKLQKLFDNLFIDKQKGICELKCYSESNDMSKKDNNENRQEKNSPTKLNKM